jgi:hypothetical protein
MTQTPDHFEKVNSRRDELMARNVEKTRLATKRLADLRGEVLTVRADADKAARNYNLIKSNALRAHVAQIEETVRTLTNVELPRLKAEAEQILSINRHPELNALWRAAETKAQNSRTENARSACDSLTEAKSAFYGHLASLATAETIDFARAVLAAETAANVEHCEAGRNLLTLLGPKAAA